MNKTVSEFIKELEALPQDAEIVSYSSDFGEDIPDASYDIEKHKVFIL